MNKAPWNSPNAGQPFRCALSPVYIYFKQLLWANQPLQANIFGKDSKLDLMSSESSASRLQLGKEIVFFHWVKEKKREKMEDKIKQKHGERRKKYQG